MAEDLTVAEVRERFLDYASMSDAVVSYLIAESYEITDVSRSATLYCVGHLLAIHPEQSGKADGGSGELMSEKEGELVRSYKTQACDEREVFFSTTAYGRRVLALENRSPGAVMSTVVA